MKIRSILIALSTFALSAAAVAAPSSIAGMKWQRRVLLVSSPEAGDARLARQRHILDGWQPAGAARDITLVVISGRHVDGVSDGAAGLRQRYHLDRRRFAALLIGKDGHVAMRSAAPIDANTLERTIDAMPMRRDGQR